MRFEELPLYDAVCVVRSQMIANREDPGSKTWDTDEAGRCELTQRVMQQLIQDADQKIIDAWITCRKSSTVNGGLKKMELLIDVSRAHGVRCFYGNRGKGPCSEDVHLDRIIPGSRGGEYSLANCVLACGIHNTMRGDKSIEEFLSHAEAA